MPAIQQMDKFCRVMLSAMMGLAVACSPKFKIGSDVAPDAKFEQYTSFRKDNRNLFIKRSNAILGSEITRRRIELLINQQLAAKGYTQAAEGEAADLIFNFQSQIMRQQEVSQSAGSPMMYNPYWGGGWGYWNRAVWTQPQTFVRDYEETTLIVDVIDAKTNKLIWQGWMIGELKFQEADWVKTLETEIGEMFKNFPPKR